MAVFRTRQGRLFSLHASWRDFRNYLGLRFEVLGSRGRVEVDLTTRKATSVTYRDGQLFEDETLFELVEPDPSWAAELEAFRDAIFSEERLDGDGAAGLAAQRFVAGAYESARLGGQPVSVL